MRVFCWEKKFLCFSSVLTFTEDYAIIAALKLKEVDPDTPYVYEMVNTIAYSFADGSITVLD